MTEHLGSRLRTGLSFFRTWPVPACLIFPAVLLASTAGLGLAAGSALEPGSPANALPVNALSPAAPGLSAASELRDETRNRRVESTLGERMSLLGSVICHEQITRYELKENAIKRRDTLDTDVEVLNGTEKYSELRWKQKQFWDIQQVPGTWSVGEMATVLGITREAVRTSTFQFRDDDIDGLGPAVEMDFSYPASSRRWYLKVNSRIQWMAFEGRLWISRETGDVLRVSLLAKDLPLDTGVAEVFWHVDFGPVDLGSHTIFLPQEAVYQVTYQCAGNRVDRNVTRFSQYRRYGADTTIHFATKQEENNERQIPLDLRNGVNPSLKARFARSLPPHSGITTSAIIKSIAVPWRSISSRASALHSVPRPPHSRP